MHNNLGKIILKSGIYSYTLETAFINPRSLLNLLDKERFDRMCKDGCGHYGNKWSCPPHSPNYKTFSDGFKNLCVVLLYFRMDQLDHLQLKNYAKLKAANAILKFHLDRALGSLAASFGRYISTGSCRLCRQCGLKLGLTCEKPYSMTYSYEAMGIDVGGLTQRCFDFKLQWSENGSLPEHTCVVGGLLANIQINVKTIIDAF